MSGCSAEGVFKVDENEEIRETKTVKALIRMGLIIPVALQTIQFRDSSLEKCSPREREAICQRVVYVIAWN